MVPSDWDLALMCICGPNFRSNSSENSPDFLFVWLLFYYKDIKQEIVHTLLLEEYGVSKKWVIMKDKKQDSNTASTPSEASGPSAQDRYVARSSGGVSRKRGRNGEE